MLKKTTILLAIFLVGLLAITAASAADNTAGDVGMAEDMANVEMVNDEPSNGESVEILGAEENDAIKARQLNVTGNSFEDIRDAIDNAEDGDTVNLDGITYWGDGNPINVSKSLNIIGKKGTILDAQGKFGILYINHDNVVLENIKFINANYEGCGSAIVLATGYNQSVINCSFENNHVYGDSDMGMGYGGAIFVQNNASITNCSFTNNSAQNGHGAISGAGTITVHNCSFTDNAAPDGNDIHDNFIYIYNSTFRRGIGIDFYIWYLSLIFSLESNLDYGNSISSSNYGGLYNISFWNGTEYVTLENPDNLPNWGSFTYANEKMIIELYNSTGDLIDCISNFTDASGNINYFAKWENGNYNYSAYAFYNQSKIVSVGSFQINIGDFERIGQYLKNAETTLELNRNFSYSGGLDRGSDGIFIHKPITINGNGFTIDAKHFSRIFYINSDNVTIKNLTLANSMFSEMGGAIYWDANNANILDCCFVNNTANWGGANYFSRDSTNVTITGTFINNIAKLGGANCFFGVSTNVTITGTFIGNTADDFGAANYFHQKLTNASINGNYVNNTAKNGGINHFAMELTNTTITGTFINNKGGRTVEIWRADQNNIIKDSIFIDNTDSEIYSFDADVLLADSWFGNNASDYNQKPDVDGVNIKNLLFLNATANPNTIIGFNSSEIIFKLFVYDLTSQNVSDYNNPRLMPINLTLTSTNGTLNTSVVRLGEHIKYTANSTGTGSIMATMENVAYTIEVNIIKLDPDLSVQGQISNYGQNATIALYYNPNATGKVNITLTGKKHNKNYENQDINTTITFKDNILPDEYTVTVTYSGDKIFKNATAYGNLTVKSLDSNMKVTGHTINVTDTNGVIFTITLPENATGKLNISNKSTINVAESGIKKNNNLIIDIANAAYPVGQYNWTFTYYDDDIYGDSSANAAANILIIKTQITPTEKTVNLTIGDASKITYTINPVNAVGNITFTSSNTSIASVDSKGNVKAIGYGSAVITVSFEGCENYTPSNANVSFNVAKAQSTLDINGTSIYFGEDAVLNYTTVNATGIEVTITDWLENPLTEGVDYNITVTGTQIILNFFDDGIHYVNVTTKTDKNHIPITKKVTVYVNPICDLEIILNPMNQTASYGDVINWTATIVNNGPNYALNSYFDVYASEGLVFTNPNVHAYLNHYRVDVPFQLSPGGRFTILINVMVNVSNADLTLNVSVCDEYSLDPHPKNNNASATVEIRHATATVNISAKNEIISGDNLVINVELPSDAKGNVTASINDKNYTQDIKDGKASITIPKLDIGYNTVNITYSGDKKYNPAEKTLEVNVKKATPIMTASAKTFKDTDKTKKYTVTLKDINGNPIKNVKVALNVNGKTYYATTNDKGQATFKLTKLTKTGTFTATVTYLGDSRYNKVSVKSKLTVKATWKTISKGSKNHAMVKKIQKALKKNGYYLRYKGHYLKVDGIYHDCTVRAVKQFQKAKGLKVTGKVDYATAKKLKLI